MRLTETTYIYVIGMPCVQAVKIGWTIDVDMRLASLQTGSPFPLVVLWQQRFAEGPAVESALHQRFADKRVRGEWFDLGPDAARIVREACEEITGLPMPANAPAAVERPADDGLPLLKPHELVYRDAGRWAASLEESPEDVSIAELIDHIRAFTDGQGARLWNEMSDHRMARMIRGAYRECSAPEPLRLKGDRVPLGLISGLWRAVKAQATIEPRLAPHFDIPEAAL